MNRFREEIYQQPQAILRTVQHVADQLDTWQYQQFARFKSFVLTGMGSSYGAAYYGAAKLALSGIPAIAIETSELLDAYRPFITDDTLIVAISQSGRSGEIVRLLDSVTAPVLGITNDPESPLAQRSAMLFPIQAGEETCASSKTYTCTLAALSLFCSVVTDASVAATAERLRIAAHWLQQRLPRWDRQMQDCANSIAPEHQLVFMGRGPAYASAFISALLCHEAAKRPAMYLNSAQFRHGFLEALSSNIQYILFAGAASMHNPDWRLAHEIACRGGRVCLFNPLFGSPATTKLCPGDEAAPLLEIVPAQLLAAHLADQAQVRPEVFRFGQKVTLEE